MSKLSFSISVIALRRSQEHAIQCLASRYSSNLLPLAYLHCRSSVAKSPSPYLSLTLSLLLPLLHYTLVTTNSTLNHTTNHRCSSSLLVSETTSHLYLPIAPAREYETSFELSYRVPHSRGIANRVILIPQHLNIQLALLRFHSVQA